MATMLMVQEEREVEGDEFSPEPEPEVVEDVCEVPLDQKASTVAEQRQRGLLG